MPKLGLRTTTMSPRFIRLTLAILPIVAACSLFTSWRNPNLPASQAAADERLCRQEAEADMGPQSYSPPGGDRPQTESALAQVQDAPMQLADRDDIQHQFYSLVAHCMERKGYSRGD